LKNKGEPGKFHMMKTCILNHKFQYLVLVLLIFFSPLAYGDNANELPSYFQTLIERLSKEGFDFEFLSKLLKDPRAELILAAMTISLDSKEIPEQYTQFLTSEAILLSKKFLRQNHKILREVETRFHVEKEVVVAILLVESKFGKNIGEYRVIPILASMALMDSPENIQKNYQAFQEANPELSCEWLEGFAKRKANWAYHELKCFLRIVQDEKIDPLEVYSSSAGALGMAQFIPSSYLAYAQSKKGLKNWLLNKEEAIFSIGNYLKSHGWKKKLPTEKKKELLWYYNRSEPYVETILQVAQKIRNR
jgi:membrane-bound lytic murein transglycosylase B